jgi:hypothetical protein
MTELTREVILALDDLTREAVKIPEWNNGTVYVRTITGDERDWLDGGSFDDQGKPLSAQVRLQNYRGRLVALATCRQDGSSIFHLNDAEALGKKSAKALDRIVDVAQRLNAITDDEVTALTKNSETAPDAAPGSDSPAPSA